MARKRTAPKSDNENKSPTQRRKLNPNTKTLQNQTPKKHIENKSTTPQLRKSSPRLKRKAEKQALNTPIHKKLSQKPNKTPKSNKKSQTQSSNTTVDKKSPVKPRKSTPKKKHQPVKQKTNPQLDNKQKENNTKENNTKENPKQNLKQKPKHNVKLNRQADYQPRLVTKTIKSAVDALKKDAAKVTNKRAAKAANNLDDIQKDRDEMFVHLVITLRQAPFKPKFRPYSIPLKHTLYKPGETEVCFFVKDPQRLMKDHLDANGHGGVTRVMGIDKLRKRYSTYEARNELADEYDLFLVDNRVAPMMPSLLGKGFLNKKKMPLAVDVRRDVVSSIQKMMSGTSLLLRQGSCLSVRIGKMAFDSDELVDNIEMAMQGVVKKIQGGWLDVQAVSLKTDKSPALPIYRQEISTAEK